MQGLKEGVPEEFKALSHDKKYFTMYHIWTLGKGQVFSQSFQNTQLESIGFIVDTFLHFGTDGSNATYPLEKLELSVSVE